jgi:hypothetical protein
MELNGRGTAKDETRAFALFQRICEGTVLAGCDLWAGCMPEAFS